MIRVVKDARGIYHVTLVPRLVLTRDSATQTQEKKSVQIKLDLRNALTASEPIWVSWFIYGIGTLKQTCHSSTIWIR